MSALRRWLKRHFGPIDPHRPVRLRIMALLDASDAAYKQAIASGEPEYRLAILSSRCLALSEACSATFGDE